MDVARFKQIFDTLDEEGQKNVISQLSDEELDAVTNWKPEQEKPSVLSELRPEVTRPEFVIGVGRGLSNLYTGGKELASSVGEKLGLVPAGTERSIRSMADEEARLYQKALARESPAFRAGASAGEITGTVGPFFALPGGQTAAARIGLGTLYGGGLAAATHIPAESEETRLSRAAKGAALGGTISGGFEAINKIRNLPGILVGRKMRTPIAQEGVALEKTTGIPMTFGEKSGDPFLSALEQQIPHTTGTISARNKQLHTSIRRLSETLKKSEKNPVGVANKVKEALDDTVGIAEARRAVVANKDYGQFKSVFGNQKAITTSNTLGELSKIADEYSVGASQMGRQAKTIASQLQKLADDSGNISVDQFLNLRSRMSSVMAGKGNLFKDIDRSLDVHLAGRVMDALNKDIQATSTTLSNAGNKTASDLLSKAVTNYQKNSQAISEIENSALGKIFKTDTFVPEKAAESLIKMQPSEVKAAFSILGNRNKDAAELIKSHYIRSAIRGSMKGPESLATQSRIQPGDLVKNLTDYGGVEKLRSMFPDKTEFTKVMNSVRTLERLADSVKATSGANQAARSQAAEVARNVAGGPSLFWAGTLAKIASPIGLRKALLTEQGRKALETLTNPVANQAAIIKAAQYFEDTGE